MTARDLTEAGTVIKYEELYHRAAAVGLALRARNGRFEFNIRAANGLIAYRTLPEVEMFVWGYELGFKAGL